MLSNPTSRLTLHSDVVLTEEEICEALISAKVTKGIKEELERNSDVRKRKWDDIMKIWSAKELLDYCRGFYFKRFNKMFDVDENNAALIKQLSLYFSGDKEFEKGNYSLSKGIMIMGNVGTGKTEIMKYFQKNKKCCFSVVSVIDVADEFSYYKDEIDDVYSTPIKKPLHDPDVFFQPEIGYCFDDLGTEEVKNNYGNKKNVMADVLMAIYNKKTFSKFHITTNLSSKEEIEAKYGTKINSRLGEMFNVFVLSGLDRRK